MEFVHRSWPARASELPAIRRELVRWLEPLGLSEDEIADLVLAVDEAVENVLEHAYRPDQSGQVELTLWTESDALSIEVVDHGRWRPPNGGSGPPRGGLGIRLMQTMAEAVLIRFDERGSRVLLRHRLPHAAPGPREETGEGDSPEPTA